jgi:transcriptional regulator
MYTPALFKDPSLELSYELIRDNMFATLLTSSSVPAAPELQISHLPLLLRKNVGEHGTLIGHMARANAHWKFLENGVTTAIFHGPHTYITPSWYVATENVPTWNYAVVHVQLKATLVHDDQTLRNDLTELVAWNEQFSPQPWTIDAVPAEYIGQLSRGIVGFHLEIQSIEGKFKLSQNRSEPDRAGVLKGLATRTDEMSAQVLAMMMKRD